MSGTHWQQWAASSLGGWASTTERLCAPWDGPTARGRTIGDHDVILVSVPYAALQHASPALGVLQASLDRCAITAKTVHANLLFAKRIGIGNYAFFADFGRPMLLGELTFALAAFPDHDPPLDDYVEALGKPETLEVLHRLRRDAAAFIDDLAHDVVARDPAIVGCSSTFQQNCASLALLRRVKELAPHIVTMMGGANCESEMGRAIHSNFGWVDYVVSGEADDLMPLLCEIVLGRRPSSDLKGLRRFVLTPDSRALGRFRPVDRATKQDMDDVPLPNYDDYYEALVESGIEHFALPGLLFQTARGCWWGEKHPCTFCGLNGGCMTYRAMSADTATKRIRELTARYGTNRIELIDNILETSYFKTVLPDLADDPGDLRMACEVKANLTREQVRGLAEAGMLWIQPGIEALHDDALRNIDKGTTLCQNLQLMKWAREHGIHVTWNYLMGIPGETPDWYGEVADVLPLIVHLAPPNGPGSRVSFDRFSVYHSNAERWGIELTPAWAYPFVYPLPPDELFDLAYHFDDKSEAAATRAEGPEKDAVRQGLLDWCRLHPEPSAYESWVPLPPRPRLDVWELDGGDLLIEDTRPCAVAPEHTLTGLAADVYRLCDRGRTPEGLLEAARDAGHRSLGEDDVAAAVQPLIDARLLLVASGRYLSLAVRAPYPECLPIDQHPDGQVFMRPVRRTPDPRTVSVLQAFHVSPSAEQGAPAL